MSKMISKEKMFWSFNTFYPLVLWGNVWRSMWRICMWIFGVKGLIQILYYFRYPNSFFENPFGNLNNYYCYINIYNNIYYFHHCYFYYHCYCFWSTFWSCDVWMIYSLHTWENFSTTLISCSLKSVIKNCGFHDLFHCLNVCRASAIASIVSCWMIQPPGNLH